MNHEITFVSSLFYLYLSLIVLIVSFLAEKCNNRYLAFFLILILSVVSGFRDKSVGRDTEEYVEIFYKAKNGIVFNKDVGFSYLCSILMQIFNNYTVLLLLFSFIIYGFIISRFWELRQYSSFCISVFSFYSFYYFESLNIMRQFCAIAIVFWAERYVEKKNYLTFMLYVLLATILFHRSAIIGIGYLVLEVLTWKSLPKKNKRILFGGIIIGLACGGWIMSSLSSYTEQYNHYFNAKSGNSIGLRVIALYIIWICSIIFLNKRNKKNYEGIIAQIAYIKNSSYESNLLLKVRVYYLVGVSLSMLGYFYDFMGRIGYYHIIFVFVYFGMIAKSSNNTYKNYQKYSIIVMIAFIVAYVLFGYIFKINGSYHHPYHLFFQQAN